MQHFASEAAADPLPEKSQEETRRKQEPRYLNRKKKTDRLSSLVVINGPAIKTAQRNFMVVFFFFYLFDGEKTYATRWGPPTAKRNGRSIFSCSPLSPLLLLLLHLLPSSTRKDLKQQQRFVDDRGHHNNHKKKWILTSHLHFCRVPRWLITR